MAETKYKNERLSILSAAIIMILVLATALYIWRLKALRFKKDAVISQISAELAVRDKVLADRQDMYVALSERLEKEIEINSHLRNNANNTDGYKYSKIFDLYSRQWNIISSLCTTYLNTTDKNEKSIGYSKVMKNLSELGTLEYLDQLVDGINRRDNGILDSIRNSASDITTDDIYMLALANTGASLRIISLILGKNQSTLYNRRDRIIKRIKVSSSISKKEILNFLGIK